MEPVKVFACFFLLSSLVNYSCTSVITRRFIVRRYKIDDGNGTLPLDIRPVQDDKELLRLVAAALSNSTRSDGDSSDTTNSQFQDRSNYSPPTHSNEGKYLMPPPHGVAMPMLQPPNLQPPSLLPPNPLPAPPTVQPNHPDAPDDMKDNFNQRDSHDLLPELLSSGRLRVAPWQQSPMNPMNQRNQMNHNYHSGDQDDAWLTITSPLLLTLKIE